MACQEKANKSADLPCWTLNVTYSIDLHTEVQKWNRMHAPNLRTSCYVAASRLFQTQCLLHVGSTFNNSAVFFPECIYGFHTSLRKEAFISVNRINKLIIAMETRCFFKVGTEFLNFISMIFVFQWLKYCTRELSKSLWCMRPGKSRVALLADRKTSCLFWFYVNFTGNAL
jgi:hypothetical protein